MARLEYINAAQDFYKVISESNNTIARSTSWLVFFELPDILTGKRDSTKGYSLANQKEPTLLVENNHPAYTGRTWEVRNAQEIASKYKWLLTHGCMYASKVQIPGENYGTERLGQFVTGYQRGLAGKGRAEFQHLSIDFMETNASFTDFVLRPWAILVGHNSLKISTAKTTIHVVPLQKTFGDATDPRGPIVTANNKPRKVFSYFNCWPQFIGPETYTHLPDQLITRTVNFAFDWYSVMEGENKEEILYEPDPRTLPIREI